MKITAVDPQARDYRRHTAIFGIDEALPRRRSTGLRVAALSRSERESHDPEDSTPARALDRGGDHRRGVRRPILDDGEPRREEGRRFAHGERG